MKDGGSAFPRQTFEYYPSLKKTHAGSCDPGMSLRDWFAGQAIAGYLSNLMIAERARTDPPEGE